MSELVLSLERSLELPLSFPVLRQLLSSLQTRRNRKEGRWGKREKKNVAVNQEPEDGTSQSSPAAKKKKGVFWKSTALPLQSRSLTNFSKKKKTPGSLFLFLAHAGANAFHTTFQLHLPVFQIEGEKRRKKKERKGR